MLEQSLALHQQQSGAPHFSNTSFQHVFRPQQQQQHSQLSKDSFHYMSNHLPLAEP
jgi:hypothetical protein